MSFASRIRWTHGAETPSLGPASPCPTGAAVRGAAPGPSGAETEVGSTLGPVGLGSVALPHAASAKLDSSRISLARMVPSVVVGHVTEASLRGTGQLAANRRGGPHK